MSAVPTVYGVLAERLVDADIASLRMPIVGAAPLPAAVAEAFRARTGVALCEGYGLTEATCASAVSPPGAQRPGTVGRRMPYQDIRAARIDEGSGAWELLPDGEVGAIVIKGPTVFAGYLVPGPDGPRPEPRPKVRDGWLDTGDLGSIDADGYVRLTGRAKDLIIRGGHNIDPQTIEDALLAHPAVVAAAAVGRPDPHAGEVPVAYVTLAAGAAATEDDLRAWAAARAPEPAAAPKRVDVVDAIPLTAVGKVFKPELRRRAAEAAARDALAGIATDVAARTRRGTGRRDRPRRRARGRPRRARAVRVRMGEHRRGGSSMRLRTTAEGLIAHDPQRDRWVRLPGEHDLLAFLAAGDEAHRRAEAAIAADDAVEADPGTAGLPFRPRSIRAFMLWESHVIASSRMLVKRFFPAPAAKVMLGFERVTGKPFPKLKPNDRFREAPTFYVANHTSVLADGEDMWWPSHTRFLDFELELACVLAKPLVDATPEEALDAVGGWFVLNDWSARDVQADDARRNVFGPVIKAKTFANSIGCDVLTADALPDWTAATGRVRVDGELWCEGTTADPQHTLGAMLAYASAGEKLDAGDVISTGHDAGLLRARARPLDPARPDRRARDRRHRHARQPDQPDRPAGVTP